MERHDSEPLSGYSRAQGNVTTSDRETTGPHPTGFIERVVPGAVASALEDDHVARYAWSSRYVDNDRTLDVACGSGYGTAMLADRSLALTVGLDIDFPALVYAQHHYHPSLIQGDATRIPFRENSFDLIVSFETIEHLAHPATFLAQCRHILKTRGLLLLSTPNLAVSPGGNPFHVREFDLEDLHQLIIKNGFRVRRTFGQHWRFDLLPLRRVKGVRRLLRKLSESPRVSRGPSFIKPIYWCLECEKVD